MRLEIRYRTTVDYPDPVVESQNELRACPTTDRRQQLLHYAVNVEPSARTFHYVDYFGTRVDTFGVRSPHPRLEVVAEATVDTHQTSQLMAATARFSDLRTEAFRLDHLDYLGRTVHVDWSGDVATEAAERAELAGDDVAGALLSMHRWVATKLDYAPGSTIVGTQVDEIRTLSRGVCQDYAHLLIAMCRSQGIPARYVSGYFFAAGGDSTVGDEPPPVGDEVTVQTHAWVEAAIPGAGWLALDPTNRRAVGERHVKIGHGRDYDDVAPLRGVYLGGEGQDLEVEVRMRRLQQGHQQQQ